MSMCVSVCVCVSVSDMCVLVQTANECSCFRNHNFKSSVQNWVGSNRVCTIPEKIQIPQESTFDVISSTKVNMCFNT